METIEVGCAVIERDGKILIAQRCPGDSFAGFWEFPGGKREPEESMEACLVRELREEMGIEIMPRRFLFRCDHTYPERKVELYFWFCDWVSGKPLCLECYDYAWIEPKDFCRYSFLPGDDAVLAELLPKLAYYLNRSG